MRIALAQMKNSGNMQDNLDKSIEFIREAAKNRADMYVDVEIADSGRIRKGRPYTELRRMEFYR